MTRAPSTLLELLVSQGIPERAGRLYIGACRGGPQTVSELARLAGVGRVEAYRLIQQLQRDGLLLEGGHRPKRFAPLPPAELVDRWIRRTSRHLDHLKEHRERVLADLDDILATPDESDPRKFTVLEGRSKVRQFLKRKLDAAQKEVLVSTGGFGLANAIEGGVDRSFRKARRRGVRLRIVTEVNAGNLVEAKHFAGFGELRHARGPVQNRAVVIDRSGALVFLSGEEGLGASGEDQVALWSTAASFIGLAREYHHRLWRRGEAIDARVVELEAPSTAVLPVVKGGADEPFQRLRDVAEIGMRATGVGAIRFDLPDLIETVARQLGRQMAEQVHGSTPDGVARSLADYYARHALGQLHVVRQKPLTLKVTECFACTSSSPEVGRVMCPAMLRTVLESRLGSQWDVSQPDPRRHAVRGCLFTVTAA